MKTSSIVVTFSFALVLRLCHLKQKVSDKNGTTSVAPHSGLELQSLKEKDENLKRIKLGASIFQSSWFSLC